MRDVWQQFPLATTALTVEVRVLLSRIMHAICDGHLNRVKLALMHVHIASLGVML
jgi:hypothetical protein